VECVAESSTQASQGTSYGPDIAVSCCAADGSGVRQLGPDKQCFQAMTYLEADAICTQYDYRLCTLQEMLAQKTQGAGCSHDLRHNWVSTECKVGTAHVVAQGHKGWSGWGSAADSYCQSDTNNQAAYHSSKHARNIGVGCCSQDGSTGYRPDCNAHPATYQEAVTVCTSRGYRLCTAAEILNHKTSGKGCWYNAAYEWTSDECDISANAAISAGFSAATGSDDESRSFEDFLPMVLGAAAGTALVASMVAMVLVMRKRKSGTKVTGHGMGGAVHVPDASAMSVEVATVVPVVEETANTQKTDEVVVETATE